MKKILIIIIISALLTACSNNTQEQLTEYAGNANMTEEGSEIMQNTTLATKQFIMEYFGLSEKDLEGIAVEDIIQFYNMTEESVKSSSQIVEKLKRYQENMQEERAEDMTNITSDSLEVIPDMSYLLKGEAGKGIILDTSSIIYIVLVENSGDMEQSYFIDFQSKKSYYSHGTIAYTNPQKSEAITDVSNERLQEIIIQLKQEKVTEWKAKYIGNNGNTTGSYGWKIGIGYTTGEVLTSSGSGMFGNNKPSGFDKVKDSIVSVK